MFVSWIGICLLIQRQPPSEHSYLLLIQLMHLISLFCLHRSHLRCISRLSRFFLFYLVFSRSLLLSIVIHRYPSLSIVIHRYPSYLSLSIVLYRYLDNNRYLSLSIIIYRYLSLSIVIYRSLLLPIVSYCLSLITRDINGWELKKALTLAKKNNATLFEWMTSPIVYKQDTEFSEKLREIIFTYYNKTYLHTLLISFSSFLLSFFPSPSLYLSISLLLIHLHAEGWRGQLHNITLHHTSLLFIFLLSISLSLHLSPLFSLLLASLSPLLSSLLSLLSSLLSLSSFT
jgi:RNA repair pathway DNA polymerase beta family